MFQKADSAECQKIENTELVHVKCHGQYAIWADQVEALPILRAQTEAQVAQQEVSKLKIKKEISQPHST